MKHFKLIILSVFIFTFFTVPVLSFHDPMEMEFDDQLSKKRENVRKLFNDISTLNLLNGLYLTEHQMKEVLKLANKAQQIKQGLIEKKGSVYMAALDKAERAFRDLFDEVMKGEPAREGSDIEREALYSERQLKEMTDNIMRRMTDELSVLDRELSEILTPEQQQVIDGFRPCLIPPKDLKNPVRAGQASSNDRVINMLRRVREVPDYVWNNRKYQILSRHIERFSRHRSLMTREEKEEELQRLLTLFEKARAMSDTDFELEKDNLAEELRPVNRVQELREELEKRSPYLRQVHISKRARFLLNQRIIPILEERIKSVQDR